jgi:16S rRNA (cytidine1402-2'-O)-methyltransferase
MTSFAGCIAGVRTTGAGGSAGSAGGVLTSGVVGGAAAGGGGVADVAVVAPWGRGPDNDPGLAHAVKSSDAVTSSAKAARVRAISPRFGIIGRGIIAVTTVEALPAIGQALYVVATPLGNLRDISLRALDVLAQVDLIAAEDTRVTARLLARHGIVTRQLSLHAHNERRRAGEIVALLAAGKSVALVTDAGTPGVSDPGAAVVQAAAAAGHSVVPIPGPSAVVAALSVSGLAASQWLFCGFLPATAAARRTAIMRLKDLPFALVFYEAPHRIAATLDALVSALGPERRLVVARELTKRFESIYRGSLGEAGAWLASDANHSRGEFVLVVDAPDASADVEGAADTLERTLATLLAELPLAQAVRLATALTGAPRKRAYARALALTQATRR